MIALAVARHHVAPDAARFAAHLEVDGALDTLVPVNAHRDITAVVRGTCLVWRIPLATQPTSTDRVSSTTLPTSYR